MTVVLRRFEAADAAWADGWLAAAAAEVRYEIDSHTPGAALARRLDGDRRMRARVIVRDGADVGLLVYRVDDPKRDAGIIELVATAPGQARRGAGMAAAAAVERELYEAGVRTVYAPAPAAHGIGLYFWIRLGYRPLLRPEWPCARAGVAWLVRGI